MHGHCDVNIMNRRVDVANFSSCGLFSLRQRYMHLKTLIFLKLKFRTLKSCIIFSYFYRTIHLILFLFQSGAFMSDGRFYQIEPLPYHLHQRTALKETGHHVIIRRSVNSLMKERIKSVPVKGIILGCLEKRNDRCS